jgi:hypothetical protein
MLDFTLDVAWSSWLWCASQELRSNFLRLRRSSNGLNIANRGSLDDGYLRPNIGSGGKLGRASLDGNALLLSTEATVGVGGDANGVLLGEALGVLGSSLSLGEVNSLEDGDGTLDGEGPVLGLDGEGGVSGLSAFAAVGLADLVELGVGDGVELGNLAGFGVLLVTLRDTSTEAWELSELAGALNVESGEVQVANANVARCGGVITGEALDGGDFSEVLDVLLAEAGSGDDTSEEGD